MQYQVLYHGGTVVPQCTKLTYCNLLILQQFTAYKYEYIMVHILFVRSSIFIWKACVNRELCIWTLLNRSSLVLALLRIYRYVQKWVNRSFLLLLLLATYANLLSDSTGILIVIPSLPITKDTLTDPRELTFKKYITRIYPISSILGVSDLVFTRVSPFRVLMLIL